jgi:cis-3-alkyl-4-acyloxetan-2-one decarboxylase
MTADWRRLYPFAPHHIDVDGGRMHYVDEGAGKPVLFVHGNPTWSFYWRELITALAPTHRCIAPDHIGCGLSDKPQDWPYRLDGHIRNLEALVLSLDLRDITLVVHDWGGAIGLGCAGRHPERFSRFFVLNTAAFPSPRIPARIAMCRIPGLGALGVRGLNGFAMAATVMATEKGLAPEVKAGLVAPYDSWQNRIATLRFVEDIPMAASHPSWATLEGVAKGLERLQGKPMTLMWGEKDWCFTPQFREEFERRMPGAESIRYADAGHYVVEDAKDRLIPAIVARCTA